MKSCLALVVLASAGAAVAQTQDTFVPQHPASSPAPTPVPAVSHPASEPVGSSRVKPDPAESLQGYSLLVVTPPEPHKFRMHDLVTIVVDESSQQSADQKLNTEKKLDNTAQLLALLDTQQLAELRLDPGNTNLKMLDLHSDNKFDGKGTYQRNDKLQMKVQAEVIDVKPNGTLALEARKAVDKNGETQTTVLSGVCRSEDITANNTVFSSQIANLTLSTKSEGSVDQAGRKGIITRVLDALFAF